MVLILDPPPLPIPVACRCLWTPPRPIPNFHRHQIGCSPSPLFPCVLLLSQKGAWALPGVRLQSRLFRRLPFPGAALALAELSGTRIVFPHKQFCFPNHVQFALSDCFRYTLKSDLKHSTGGFGACENSSEFLSSFVFSKGGICLVAPKKVSQEYNLPILKPQPPSLLTPPHILFLAIPLRQTKRRYWWFRKTREPQDPQKDAEALTRSCKRLELHIRKMFQQVWKVYKNMPTRAQILPYLNFAPSTAMPSSK